MGYHPIESLMRTTMDSLKDMVDVNTVVGEPVETKEGTVIIPVSRVSFGFVTGGGDEAVTGGEGEDSGMPERSGGGQSGKDQDQEQGASGGMRGCYPSMPFTGGTGAGVSVKPVGFLVVGGSKVRFLPVDSRAFYDRLIDEVPGILERVACAWEQRRGERHERAGEGRRDHGQLDSDDEGRADASRSGA